MGSHLIFQTLPEKVNLNNFHHLSLEVVDGQNLIESFPEESSGLRLKYALQCQTHQKLCKSLEISVCGNLASLFLTALHFHHVTDGIIQSPASALFKCEACTVCSKCR